MGPADTYLIKVTAGYDSSDNAYTTTFSTAPNVPSVNYPTPFLTSKGGHPYASRSPISTKDTINQGTK